MWSSICVMLVTWWLARWGKYCTLNLEWPSLGAVMCYRLQLKHSGQPKWWWPFSYASTPPWRQFHLTETENRPLCMLSMGLNSMWLLPSLFLLDCLTKLNHVASSCIRNSLPLGSHPGPPLTTPTEHQLEHLIHMQEVRGKKFSYTRSKKWNKVLEPPPPPWYLPNMAGGMAICWRGKA